MANGHDNGLVTKRVVQFAALSVPGSEHAGLTVVRTGNPPRTTAATGPLPEQVDKIQYATGEGPCLSAITEHDISRADDLASDRQWPHFAARAVAETGVRSMFSIRLLVSDEHRAALNFYAGQPLAFTDESIATGAIFGTFAALTLQVADAHDKADHLERALESNRHIGTAIGILMARNLWTEERAFTGLRTASHSLHRKLRDIAEQVIATGDLPDPSPEVR